MRITGFEFVRKGAEWQLIAKGVEDGRYGVSADLSAQPESPVTQEQAAKLFDAIATAIKEWNP